MKKAILVLVLLSVPGACWALGARHIRNSRLQETKAASGKRRGGRANGSSKADSVAGSAFSRQDARAAIASAEALPPGGIDVLEAVEIGGIKQWISIRGADRANPILLFLHGGPGSPMMPESWTFERPWEDFFTVVQWDQRGAGKTFSAAGRRPDPTMTIGEMRADAEQLIGILRRRFHKRKIFLLGFSWGSILGLPIAEHHPGWLYAYIGVGQVVNGQENEVVGYRETLAKAKAVGNEAAVKALEALAPYPSAHGLTPLSKTLIERRWDAALRGMIYAQTADDEARIWALSPDYTDYDDTSARLGEMDSVRILWPQMAAVNFDGVTRFQCPIFIFAGKHDRTTPEALAAAYFRRIHAPEKRFFEIRNAAHYVVNEAPGEVLMDLVRYVRPLAKGGAGE